MYECLAELMCSVQQVVPQGATHFFSLPIHLWDLPPIAGASLFALQDKAANAADWAAIKGQKVTGASQSFEALHLASIGRVGAALPSPVTHGCSPLSALTPPVSAKTTSPLPPPLVQICALAGYYLNPDLKAKYGADLVEVPDEAAMLDKLVAGDCVAGTELRAVSGGGFA